MAPAISLPESIVTEARKQSALNHDRTVSKHYRAFCAMFNDSEDVDPPVPLEEIHACTLEDMKLSYSKFANYFWALYEVRQSVILGKFNAWNSDMHELPFSFKTHY
jgi:hypothetical protein